MSSLKDLASLIMVPSLYKDGELHTVKPLADEDVILHPDATGNHDGNDGTTDRASSNFTFSRGSNLAATRVDVNGLIEKGRENLLLNSNNFNTTWVKNAGATLTSGQSGYDGSTDAWRLDVTTASNSGLYQAISGSGVHTFSIYAKAGTLDYIGLPNFDGAAYSIWFNLSNGTIASQTGFIDASIESVGNGWYRCSITSATSLAYFQIKPSNTAANPSTAGYVFIQDFQAERGLVATDYIETGASTAQAGILEDMPRLDYSGGASCPALLLEPQRTNTAINSEYISGVGAPLGIQGSGFSISYNQVNSPEGVSNAMKWTEGTNNGTHWGSLFLTGSAVGQDVTISIFAKRGTSNDRDLVINIYDGSTSDRAKYNLSTGVVVTDSSGSNDADVSMIDYGDGWWRCIYTRNLLSSGYNAVMGMSNGTGGGSESYQGNGTSNIYTYGLQFENNSSYPTSYIPTYGSSVTRSSEYGTASNPDDFTTNSCTMLLEVDLPQGREGAASFASLIAGSTSVGWKGNYTPSPIVQLNGNGTISDSSTFSLSTGVHKLLFKWHNGTAEIFIDGVKKSSTITDSAAPTSFTSTKVDGGGYRLFQKHLAIFPTALTDSECIALTE